MTVQTESARTREAMEVNVPEVRYAERSSTDLLEQTGAEIADSTDHAPPPLDRTTRLPRPPTPCPAELPNGGSP